MATTLDAAMATPPPSNNAVHLDVPKPETLSRWLIFVKWLLAIPHYVILYFLAIAFSVVTLIAFFVILFTKKYPDGLFNFSVGYQRWLMNVDSYILLLRDEYPPFSLDAGAYPTSFSVDYPAELNRWLPLIKWLLAFPHYIVLAVLWVAASLLVIIVWFTILITGKVPQMWFDFIVGTLRYTQRVNMYTYLLTDDYPPFSLR